MPRPVAGRRTDSLFDNRFRYDHIYPRGRSGETLHAYDTLDADRPVVIKRPAPQDAPPMRAGQEVSILNEKRALERLAGHPVLTELRHSGTFRVGGQTHQYIAIDLAEGVTVEDYVLDLASRGERLPELETLVILDNLLDLLDTAHARKIVYNDVDAKHLFWDRAHYRLKVIDWGNAVFLDGDTAHITRAADVSQAAELLYFILSGGHRLEIDRRANEAVLNLPDDVSPRLKPIITRATQPDPAGRYADIAGLRRDLAEVRRPLEKARDQVVDRVRSRLPTATSQDQLDQLAETLNQALVTDPGFPSALALHTEIEGRLRQLSIQGDLDAARIYIESGNTSRATALLNDVLARAGDTPQPLLLFLLDVAEQFDPSNKIAAPGRPPAGLASALDALYRGDAQAAGRILVTTPEARQDAYTQQLLLAERLTLRMPEVVLLRPHVVRLDQALGTRTADRAALMRIMAPLDTVTERGIQPLRKAYAAAAEGFAGFTNTLEGDLQASAKRAQQAAATVADLLNVSARNVLDDASRAGNALWQAGAIDPSNAAFDALNGTLNTFHSELDTLSVAAPNENVLAWLTDARTRLSPYAADIPDNHFQTLLHGLDNALIDWQAAVTAFALGGRRPAMDAYTRAADDVRPLNETVARWFSDHARQIEDAKYIETLSPNAALGRALADGWDAWDRGRNIDAQDAALRARTAAQTDGERAAADRLHRLSELTAAWLSSDGMTNAATTDAAEAQIMGTLLPNEDQIRNKFSEQMPNTTIYLKAMARGLVEPMRDASSAAVRVLFMHCVLRGVLALQNEQLDEVAFWKEAAAKTLPGVRMHPAYQALDSAITRRQLLIMAQQTLNAVRGVADLPAARQAIRAPLAAAQLDSAEQAFRALDDALRRWADGDFRAARQYLDTALERISAAEKTMDKPLESLKQWLSELSTSVEALQGARRQIEQAALIPANAPDPAVGEAHQQIVDVTWKLLGEDYASLLRQWRDTYTTIRQTYQDDALTKAEKLRLFEGHFASLFIDRHPAYPIYRHWQSVIALQPDPQPQYTETAPQSVSPAFEPTFVTDSAAAPYETNAALADTPPALIDTPSAVDLPAPPPEVRFPWLTGIAVVAVIGVVVVVALLALQNRPPGSIALTLPASATRSLPIAALPISATARPSLTATPIATFTTTAILPSATAPLSPSATLTASPTAQQFVPTETPPPSTTPIGQKPSPVNAPSIVPTTSIPSPGAPSPSPLSSGQLPGTPVSTPATSNLPTIPPNATGGPYDLLQGIAQLPTSSYTWTADLFANTPQHGWQLGTTNVKAGNTIQPVRIGSSILAQLYGADASRHITRVDATLELSGYDPALMPTGQVYFGLGFDTPQGQRAAAQVKLTQAQVITLGTSINGKFTARSMVPTSSLKITLSARRNTDNTVSVYADGQLLGTTSAAVYGPATPVSIVIYTSGQSVIVSVSALSVRIG